MISGQIVRHQEGNNHMAHLHIPQNGQEEGGMKTATERPVVESRKSGFRTPWLKHSMREGDCD